MRIPSRAGFNRLDAAILGGLRCFGVVARELSFTRAAAEMNLTQSAVSQQIRNLESRLGYLLFERGGRNLQLTGKGRILIQSVEASFESLESALHGLDEGEATIRVNCSPSFALQWLLPRLGGFNRQYPDIKIVLTAEFQALNRQDMRGNAIHVAIRYDEADYRDLAVTELLDEYLLPVASPAYLALHPELSKLEGLAQAVLLHDATPWDGAPPFVEWKTWLDAVFPEFRLPLTGPQFNLASLALSAALNHQGVALVRAAIAYDAIQTGALVVLFPPVKPSARYVVFSSDEENVNVINFKNWLLAECETFRLQRNALPVAELMAPAEFIADKH